MSAKTDEELNPNTDPEKADGDGTGTEASGDSTAPKAEAAKATGEEEREGGLGPAILAGVGILAVVAALVFWPTGDKGEGKDDGSAKTGAAAAQGRAADSKGGASAKGPGGVAARSVDEASRNDPDAAAASKAEFKVNPALRLPRGLGMAPGVPMEEPPPKFETAEEEIAWYEAKLERATTQLEMRRKATERLAKWKQKAEQSDDPDQELARYDQRAEVVNENYAKAQAKVAELEKKLQELRGN